MISKSLKPNQTSETFPKSIQLSIVKCVYCCFCCYIPTRTQQLFCNCNNQKKENFYFNGKKNYQIWQKFTVLVGLSLGCLGIPFFYFVRIQTGIEWFFISLGISQNKNQKFHFNFFFQFLVLFFIFLWNDLLILDGNNNNDDDGDGATNHMNKVWIERIEMKQNLFSLLCVFFLFYFERPVIQRDFIY